MAPKKKATGFTAINSSMTTDEYNPSEGSSSMHDYSSSVVGPAEAPRKEIYEGGSIAFNDTAKCLDPSNGVRIANRNKRIRPPPLADSNKKFKNAPFLLTNETMKLPDEEFDQVFNDQLVLSIHYANTSECQAKALAPRGRRFTASDLAFVDALKRNPETAGSYLNAQNAAHRKITGGLDPMDKKIIELRESGNTDNQIRTKILEEFGTLYTPKSLVARYSRIMDKVAVENARAIQRSEKEWTEKLDGAVQDSVLYIQRWLVKNLDSLMKRRYKELQRFVHGQARFSILGQAIEERAATLQGLPQGTAASSAVMDVMLGHLIREVGIDRIRDAIRAHDLANGGSGSGSSGHAIVHSSKTPSAGGSKSSGTTSRAVVTRPTRDEKTPVKARPKGIGTNALGAKKSARVTKPKKSAGSSGAAASKK